jgi:hypothetical protein
MSCTPFFYTLPLFPRYRYWNIANPAKVCSLLLFFNGITSFESNACLTIETGLASFIRKKE